MYRKQKLYDFTFMINKMRRKKGHEQFNTQHNEIDSIIMMFEFVCIPVVVVAAVVDKNV